MTEQKKHTHEFDEMDTVVEAGKILMESGAEIFRIEDTMAHMASAMQIDNFSSYVVNRGIFVSGRTREGIQESKIVTVPDSSVHLGRIEAVNSLSREIDDKKGSISVEFLAGRLQEIRKETVVPLWLTLLAYFISTGCFSLAIGSAWNDALSSAISVLIMGLVFSFIENYVRTTVLQTIIQSTIITIAANFLCLLGLGSHRGFIILGSFILLVPGALFANSIRELSENNYSTGTTMLMSSTLICISMAIGAVLGTELLPFADQMTAFITGGSSAPLFILLRTAAAGIGTAAFAFLFHSPSKYYRDQGFMGAISWLLCMMMNILFHKPALAVFVSAFAATLISRLLAVKRKCPRTVFLSISIFPLLPGLSLFWSVYLLMTGSNVSGWASMRNCLITAFAISLAISCVQQIPSGLLSRFSKSEKQLDKTRE